jgi:hypothetical protein
MEIWIGNEFFETIYEVKGNSILSWSSKWRGENSSNAEDDETFSENETNQSDNVTMEN